MKIKITERGWAGHFCASSNCNFRRNTLVEYGKKRIVISTVGNYNPPKTGINSIDERKERQQIGIERYYETMVFESIFVSGYWKANVSKEIEFKSDWAINELKHDTDQKANDMHEKVVAEIVKKITKK